MRARLHNTIGEHSFDPISVTHRYQAILAAAGLPRQRFHDLRHCCARARGSERQVSDLPFPFTFQAGVSKQEDILNYWAEPALCRITKTPGILWPDSTRSYA